MSIQDLRWLMRIYGKKARMIDVAANMKLVVEAGEKFKNEEMGKNGKGN